MVKLSKLLKNSNKLKTKSIKSSPMVFQLYKDKKVTKFLNLGKNFNKNFRYLYKKTKEKA